MSLLYAGTPHRFTGLTTIGKIFFIVALVMYVAVSITIASRFFVYPHTLRCSLMHPTESLFIPTAILTCKYSRTVGTKSCPRTYIGIVATLLACVQIYGTPHCGPWLIVAVRVLFWIYVAIAFTSAVLQYLYLFCGSVHRLTIQSMTPAWILPIFPVLLGAVVASIIAPAQPLTSRWTIVVCGLTLLGMGWMVAFLIYPLYLYRLMTLGLPAPNLRPGMFIAVGPPAFTGLALINFGSTLAASKGIGFFTDREVALTVLSAFADLTAVFLWAFSFWFFSFSLIAFICGIRSMSFHLVWWAGVFPNAVLALATGRIGQRLKSEGIMWVASAIAILLTAAWLFVIALNIRAVFLRQILMPGKGEDKGQ
jgi:tellurite resistance protein TehA-like permease